MSSENMILETAKVILQQPTAVGLVTMTAVAIGGFPLLIAGTVGGGGALAYKWLIEEEKKSENAVRAIQQQVDLCREQNAGKGNEITMKESELRMKQLEFQLALLNLFRDYQKYDSVRFGFHVLLAISFLVVGCYLLNSPIKTYQSNNNSWDVGGFVTAADNIFKALGAYIMFSASIITAFRGNWFPSEQSETKNIHRLMQSAIARSRNSIGNGDNRVEELPDDDAPRNDNVKAIGWHNS